jgi:hypothetical protein
MHPVAKSAPYVSFFCALGGSLNANISVSFLLPTPAAYGLKYVSNDCAFGLCMPWLSQFQPFVCNLINIIKMNIFLL